MIERVLLYLAIFVSSLLAVLVLTPVVRSLHARMGMVDRPDPRRINKVPVPRGGGVAIVIGVYVTYLCYQLAFGFPIVSGISDAAAHRMLLLSVAIAALGWLDDRFSLSPKVKLLGQVVIAALTWTWGGLGFAKLWPWLPTCVDCVLTVFWIVGAVNAFNLIDGLDGLASGIALIAITGMGGALFFLNIPQSGFFYFAMGGGILGFLRYNWHPASVFLGDSGSMFLGFVVSTLPLVSMTPNSFLVSVGVPLLAMGVPIFDTFLAILRRSLRHLLSRTATADGEVAQVMTADSDHLHHRLLRSTGLNQRKTAWMLYGISAVGVAIGMFAMMLKSRAGGVWLVALAFAAVVIFKDSYIEIFEAGRLASSVVHSKSHNGRRRLARLSVPFYVVLDIVLLSLAFVAAVSIDGEAVEPRTLKVYLPLRVTCVFVAMVMFRAYSTIWSRAMPSNYVRLLLACLTGVCASSVVVYYWPSIEYGKVWTISFVYAFLSSVAVMVPRVFRLVFRDVFYAVDCNRLIGRKDISRVLVYGAGLRYRTFRRELVRSTAANDRIIVGLMDDDLYLHGRYIGGIKVLGSLADAQRIVNEYNIDAVVIACCMTDKWLKVVRQTLSPLAVKVTRFGFTEEPL